MTPVELSGIDGRSLLGFLTALGTHIALDKKAALIGRLLGSVAGPKAAAAREAAPTPIRMSWNAESFRPTIYLPGPANVSATGTEQTSSLQDCLIRVLQHSLKDLGSVDKILPWENIKGIPRQKFREAALGPAARLARSQHKRSWSDFVAGLASDATVSEKEIEYTALCAITGDSQQFFLGCMHDLRRQVTDGHLKDTLFSQWKYKEEGKTFRWDPGEDRRYALRSSDPSKGSDKKIRSMWGANRIAFEALACFPCFPSRRHLRTTAFEDERVIRWPLWSPPVDLSTLRSLLAHPAIIQCEPHALGAMGVFTIGSSRRTTLGRKRTFGPASLWPVPNQLDALRIEAR